MPIDREQPNNSCVVSTSCGLVLRSLAAMETRREVRASSASTGNGSHRGGPTEKGAQFIHGAEHMSEIKFLVGIDWGSCDHKAAIVDINGTLLGNRRFKRGGTGLSALAN